MTETGTVQVEHHQFLICATDADTTDVTAEGTLIWTGPGFVSILTGIAYGPATLTLDPAPESDIEFDEWEAVEETVIEADASLQVMTIGGELVDTFGAIPADRYRVRVHARGRDSHYDLDVAEPCEEYLVQFTTTSEAVGGLTRLRRTDSAHGPSPTDAAVEGTVPHLDDLVYVGDPDSGWIKVQPDSPEAHATFAARGKWADRPPSDYLRADPRRQHTGSFVADLDRDLVDEIAALTAEQQRALARWCTRRAFERAGLTDFADFRAALDAMDNGTAPPAAFTVPSQLGELVKNNPAIPLTVTARFGGYGDSIPQFDATTAYMYSVGSDQDIEPATKAFEAVRWTSFVFGQNYPELISRIRREYLASL
ncbi:hypothetical protein [Nocardia neocaledoniensis]|uniref:hypothetical protein n=1 Tax=Nocardia neocaledoniensis TaxID=236511 RepID=UPI00245781BF|nr:hypothetical protein [Nocardia neocaledoniensis]